MASVFPPVLLGSAECPQCKLHRERLALASEMLKTVNEERRRMLADKQQLLDKFGSSCDVTLAKTAGVKRDIDSVRFEMIQLTGNNNRMLARVQATLYNLQRALQKNNSKDVSEVLSTVRYMSEKLERENETLTKQKEEAEVHLRQARHQLDSRHKTIEQMKSQFHTTQAERKKYQEFSTKYSLKKQRLLMTEKENSVYKKKNRGLSKTLIAKDEEIMRLNAELKEKAKQIFVLGAQLKEKEAQKEKEPAAKSDMELESTSSSSGPRTPIELQDLSVIPSDSTPIAGPSSAKRAKPDFDVIVNSKPQSILNFCGNLTLDDHKIVIERLSVDLERSTKQYEQLEEKLVQTALDLNKAEKSADMAKEENFQLREELAAAENERDGYSETIREKQAEVDTMFQDITVLKAQIGTGEGENQELKDLLGLSQSSLNASRLELQQLKADVHDLRTLVSDRDFSLDLKTNQLKEMYLDNRKFKDTIQSLKEQVHQQTVNAKMAINERGTEIERLRGDIQTLRHMLKERQQGSAGDRFGMDHQRFQGDSFHLSQQPHASRYGEPVDRYGVRAPSEQFGHSQFR